jgi:hypothetical protein
MRFRKRIGVDVAIVIGRCAVADHFWYMHVIYQVVFLP